MDKPNTSEPCEKTRSVGPLTRIKVLDFSHILAGPFCTRLLADLGADVVRVETVGRPDHLAERKLDSSKTVPDRPASYLNLNRNKRSITINLKIEAGRQLAARLAAVTDVIVENFSAGVMERLQLDYEHLQPLNPRLVYVSMSGYGHNGPRRDWTSMNMNLQAYTGLMMTTGTATDPPTAISNSWNDYIGGFHACFGILQTLTRRETTGTGAYLDLSQFECSVASLGALLLYSATHGLAPERLGSRATQVAPQGVYRCAGIDEWCAISIQNDDQWRSFVAAMGSPGWARSPRFDSVLGRLEGHDEIDSQIELWTARLKNADVETLLKDVGVPAARMRRIRDVLDLPDSGRIFQPLDDPKRGRLMATGIPFEFGRNGIAPFRPPPRLGEHTREILNDWLDIGNIEFADLERQGVLV
jgi:crotonobetainyl-CoA:carnitine CoA-transferase CaiB-like acyl-CoA transferase